MRDFVKILTNQKEELERLMAEPGIVDRAPASRIDLDSPVAQIVTGIRRCVTAEEAMRRGSVGEAIAAWIASQPHPIPVRILAADGFVPHGDAAALTQMLGLDGESIAEAARG